MAISQRKRKFLEAFEEYHGVLSPAAKSSHVSRKTVYQWCKKDEDFKALFDEVRNIGLDWVESKLCENIERGNVVAQLFYLKCRGKDRGWVEQIDSKVTGELQLQIMKNVVGKKEEKKCS